MKDYESVYRYKVVRCTAYKREGELHISEKIVGYNSEKICNEAYVSLYSRFIDDAKRDGLDINNTKFCDWYGDIKGTVHYIRRFKYEKPQIPDISANLPSLNPILATSEEPEYLAFEEGTKLLKDNKLFNNRELTISMHDIESIPEESFEGGIRNAQHPFTYKRTFRVKSGDIDPFVWIESSMWCGKLTARQVYNLIKNQIVTIESSKAISSMVAKARKHGQYNLALVSNSEYAKGLFTSHSMDKECDPFSSSHVEKQLLRYKGVEDVDVLKCEDLVLIYFNIMPDDVENFMDDDKEKMDDYTIYDMFKYLQENIKSNI